MDPQSRESSFGYSDAYFIKQERDAARSALAEVLRLIAADDMPEHHRAALLAIVQRGVRKVR